MIWIPVKQKRELKIYNVLKYGTSSDLCCSVECQQKMLKELSESEFLTKGTIKNRDYALIIHGADVTKRLKEKEVHLVTGNTREQRARILRDHLKSLSWKRKQFMSDNVQELLFNIKRDQLKTVKRKDGVAAWRVMKKCKEMFPDEISIGFSNGKDKYIEYIK